MLRTTMRLPFFIFLTCGLPAQGPFSPTHTHSCSCAERYADVIVTAPCAATKAFRNSPADVANDIDNLSMFLSSYVLQSWSDVPDHSRGRPFRKSTAR